MPIIDLPASCLTAPTIFDMDLVAVWMLYPDDPDWRERAFSACLANRISEAPHCYPNDVVCEALKLATKSPDLASFTQDRIARFRRGSIAGSVFYDVVAGAALGQPRSVGDMIARHGQQTYTRSGRSWALKKWSPGRPWSSSKADANETWRLFKPVAHFWAAWLLLADVTFPCRPEAMGEFLARAEQFLALVPNTHLPHSPTAFGADDPARIPETVAQALPALEPLRFVPVAL